MYSILGLKELTNLTSKFYEISETVKRYNARKKELLSKINDDNERTIIEKELNELDQKLKHLSEINEKEIKKQNEEMYHLQSNLKHKKDILLTNKYEALNRINIISNYISNLQEAPSNILEFIKQANAELADILSIKMEKALEYHKKLSVERTGILVQERKRLTSEIKDYDIELNRINQQLPSISATIKNTNEIRKLFEMQNMLFERKQNLILANQSIVEIDQLTRNIELLKQQKTAIREELIKYNLNDINKDYMNYSNELVKKLYPESYKSYFDIKIIDYNKINTSKLPITFDFRINKDNSEGVRNARNLIVDILMLKYSKSIQFMAWDSNTFNGIDPNQLKILFEEIRNVSIETGKQVIICFNTFQLGEHYTELFSNENIPESDKILFNNSNTLLNIEF